MYNPETSGQFRAYLKRLNPGVDLPFVIDEYDYQLRQLGGILDAKFTAMNDCFWWLKNCLIFYCVAVICATYVGLTIVRHGGTP